MENESQDKVLKKAVVWQDLFFYRKSDVLYQLTVEFCRRFLPAHGDRTVDQMVQAARSGKQNIVEGSEDGQTSSEMEIKLLNVARGSLQELRSDYHDYLNTRHLTLWSSESQRQQRLRQFCSDHNDYSAYAPLMEKMTDEEMANRLFGDASPLIKHHHYGIELQRFSSLSQDDVNEAIKGIVLDV